MCLWCGVGNEWQQYSEMYLEVEQLKECGVRRWAFERVIDS